VHVVSARYDNLTTVSSGLQAQGSVMKVIGLITVCGASVGGYHEGLPFGVLIVGFGILAGVGMYVGGTFMAAAGEGLLALADIAKNTTRAE
jgi:hypothetical protein